jgi:hypothetical protein
MAVLQIKSFGGISPKVPPRYLQDNQAQVATNTVVFSGALTPLQDVGATVTTLTKSGTPKTIYRFGQDIVSDSQYWFHWTTDVNVCRGQISGDTSEWTFFTGDGAPKATYSALALSGTNYPAVSRPLGLPNPDLALTVAANVVTGTTRAAVVTLSAANIALLTTTYGLQGSIVGGVDANYVTVSLTSPITAASVAAAVDALPNVSAVASSGAVVITSDAKGEDAKLYIRFRTATNATYTELFNQGYTEAPSSVETRVYAWTWVNKESGYEFESGPSPASAPLEVYASQTVSLTGRSSVPSGYVVTHWRLYRSVSGTYLFVNELPVSQTTYTDDVLAESLSEELPSLTWAPPPATLQGLTNLPNGGMAGFVGRDVYFCDPYHPHAWPENYVQSLDFPIVGLGRMDTTLAVLTTGTPYFMQGSHPDSMVSVKSDLEQSCASKRSIVSTNGAVIYASPDGLVTLSPSGSKLVTEQYFTRAQWQSYFKPDSIYGYSHDLKYIGFYDNGTTTGGFIYDPTSGQFILHNIYATAGYSDLQRDKLFLAFSDRTVKPWLAGGNLSYVWKSKKFTLPQVLGFSCAQLQAEAYPMTAKFYADNVLVHTQTVTSRLPFRLPSLPGRDWEIQLEGASEVFSLSVAQSMQELAGV